MAPRPNPDRSQLSERSQQPSRSPEPMLLAGRPDLEELAKPPSWLDRHAKVFWRDQVVKAVETGSIDRLDMPALEMASMLYGQVRAFEKQARDYVKAHKTVMTYGSAGQMKVHPAFAEARKASQQLRGWMQEFGWTPSSRVSLGLSEINRRKLADEMEAMTGGAVDVGAAVDGEAVEVYTDADL